jgi:hypothetical protein
MANLLIRFLIGGFVVSLFSTLADVLRPKSFAGLLGAAPSIALATLGLTIHHDGKQYAAFEARSMALGAIAFFLYAVIVSCLLRRYHPSPLGTTVAVMPIWFLASFCLLRLLGVPL